MIAAMTPLPGRLEVIVDVAEDEVSLRLGGELDLASVGELERQLAAARAHEPSRVIIDLLGLVFIDSSGLRAIIQADANARAEGIDLVLRPGGESVQRVFELTGALEALHFEDA
jgi:anti-sigma B factor antagonist